MMKKYLFLAIVAFIALFSCTPKNLPTDLPPPVNRFTEKKPKNIIFMIGDGMGLSQITAGMYKNGNRLHLERIKNIGLHKSNASNSLVTDSAAGATAFACGKKTYNGAIAVDPDTMPLPTILEMAIEKEMPTGLVATSTIVHATPASFFAHVKQRKMYDDIAAWFLKNQVDYFVGGGLKYFTNRENDERNLIKELEAVGYQMSDYFQKDFEEVVIDSTKKFGYLTANQDPLTVEQGRKYLQSATVRGIEHLDRKAKNGFFMMVEGSQIDWGGHANNTDYIINEMIDFDNTIGAVLDFAEKDGETLVIITADHETGGFAINKGSTMDEIKGAFTSDYHTASLIPVFAFGPGSKTFRGIYDNTAIFEKMRNAMGVANTSFNN